MLHEVSSSEKGKLAIHFTSLLKFKLSEFHKSLWKCKNTILKTCNTDTSPPEGEGDDRGWDGWHHQLNGHEFEQAPGVGDGQGSLADAVHEVAKSQTRLSNWTKLNTDT